MKKLYLCLFLLIFGLLAQAQNQDKKISVADFYYAENDLTARTHGTSVEDQNGNLCALIKVRTTEKGLWSFDVGMLGVRKTELQIAAHPAEIWVYVPFGVTRITIQYEKLGLIDKWRFPCDIDKGCTYIMVLEATPVPSLWEPQQQYLTFQVSPTNAVLEVNGQLWEVGADGSSTKFVDFGTYKYRVQAPNYHSDAGIVTVNDSENAQKVNVTLKPDFVEVTLKTDMDAEIWVNNEKKGVGTWTGTLGKGTYKIECKKVNHETSVLSQEITDAQNGQTITLPAPRPIYGSLNIESTPNYATVYIDGKAMGETPLFIKEVLVGTHELKLTKDGHSDHTETFTIAKGERKQVKAMMEEKNTQAKEKEIDWKNTFFPFYYYDDINDIDYTTYRDINGKVYPHGITFAHNQRLAVEEKNGWMIYSVDGKKFGPFDDVAHWDYGFDYDYIEICKNGKWGVVDKDGNQLIPLSYERLIKMRSPNLYIADKNGKSGVITIHNEIVEPFVYDPIYNSDYDSEKCNFYIQKGGKHGWLDIHTGTAITPFFSNDSGRTHWEYYGGVIAIENDEGLWGVYNRKGKLVIPFEYNYSYTYEYDFYSASKKYYLYFLAKTDNGVQTGPAIIVNGEGKIIADNCEKICFLLPEKYGLFVYRRWVNQQKNEKELCLADVYNGEMKAVFAPEIANDIMYSSSSQMSDKYVKFGWTGVMDLVTQRIIIPDTGRDSGWIKFLDVYRNNVRTLVSITKEVPTKDNCFDLYYYRPLDGKLMNSYKNVLKNERFCDGFETDEQSKLVFANGKAIVVDGFGNPIISSCDCDGGVQSHNICRNLQRTTDYVLDRNTGIYDLKGNLLIRGRYHYIEEDDDLKCFVAFHNYDDKKGEAYVIENGKPKRVEDKGSLSELVLSLIQQQYNKKK